MGRLLLTAIGFFMVSASLAEARSTTQLNVAMEYTAYGPVFYPNDGKATHPGVIVFHGSEGGGRAYHMLDAQRLATQGYVALAYCYYQCLKSDQEILLRT